MRKTTKPADEDLGTEIFVAVGTEGQFLATFMRSQGKGGTRVYDVRIPDDMEREFEALKDFERAIDARNAADAKIIQERWDDFRRKIQAIHSADPKGD